MKKYVSYEKLSKKDKRKVDSAKRRKWCDYGCVNPVSKVMPDRKKQVEKNICRRSVQRITSEV